MHDCQEFYELSAKTAKKIHFLLPQEPFAPRENDLPGQVGSLPMACLREGSCTISLLKRLHSPGRLKNFPPRKTVFLGRKTSENKISRHNYLNPFNKRYNRTTPNISPRLIFSAIYAKIESVTTIPWAAADS